MEMDEKINAVKSELIKIWTKCDTIDDKTTFIERKLDEKNKQISHIMEVLK